MSKKLIITIDGLAGVGKTTISRDLAKILGYKFISTGWLYRCIAEKVLRERIDVRDEEKVVEACNNIDIKVVPYKEEFHIIADGIDITEKISSPLIVTPTAIISSYAGVRQRLLYLQRELGKGGGVILEGRDIGTVVLPDADWKFFIEASFEVRLKRFFKLLTPEEKLKYPNPESFTAELKAIDEKEANRDIAPLRIPKGAIIYDNSDSPSSMQDAIILNYYITHKKEIVSNCIKLKVKVKNDYHKRT